MRLEGLERGQCLDVLLLVGKDMGFFLILFPEQKETFLDGNKPQGKEEKPWKNILYWQPF